MAELTTISTPDGPFTLVIEGDHLITAGWTDDVTTLLPQIHASLRPSSVDSVPADHSAAVVSAVHAVNDYYDGDLLAPGKVAVKQKSGPFREHAWEVLRTLEPGATWTYAEYAAASGNPKAYRAAASACAFNAVALFVPCHRIIRTDGGLGGFRWGVPVKESLLAREASALG